MALTDFQTEVVKAMGYDPDNLDALAVNQLVPRIEATKEYLIGGGMPEEFVDGLNNQTITAVAIGTNDILDGRSGQGNMSNTFKILANQLCSKRVKTSGS